MKQKSGHHKAQNKELKLKLDLIEGEKGLADKVTSELLQRIQRNEKETQDSTDLLR